MAQRILFVTAGLARGGAEGFLVRLAGRLAARGHACRVASLGGKAPLAEALSKQGVAVDVLGSGAAAAAYRLARVARSFRPEVVQGWMYAGNLAASFARRLAAGRPALIWSVRQGLNDLAQSPAFTRSTVSWSARLSAGPFAIVYNAQSAARQHEEAGFWPARSRVIPNGIDVGSVPLAETRRRRARTALGLAEDAFVVGLFARWHPVKNHRGFVRAASIFARSDPSARFVLAGSGVDRENATLASWLTEAGLSDRCLLLGERTDVSELIAALDLATLASQGEAQPNALLEAMAAGIPAVAPDVGDIADLIGPTGRVVAPDDPVALAEGWRRIAVLTRQARLILGATARTRVAERYDLDRAAAAFEALYNEAAIAGR